VTEFNCKTKIVSGAGAIGYLKELGSKRLFIVADPYFKENGTADKLAALSGAKECQIFHKVTPDPTVELAAEGTAAVKEFQPDTLVALGAAVPWTAPRLWRFLQGSI